MVTVTLQKVSVTKAHQPNDCRKIPKAVRHHLTIFQFGKFHVLFFPLYCYPISTTSYLIIFILAIFTILSVDRLAE
jgi:hypothetical protein